MATSSLRSFVLENWFLGGLLIVTAILVLLSIPFLKWTRSVIIVGNYNVMILYFMLTYVTVARGGAASTGLSLFVMLPLISFLFNKTRSGLFWTVVGFATVSAFFVAESKGIVFPAPEKTIEEIRRFNLLNYFTVIVVSTICGLTQHLNNTKQLCELTEEKKSAQEKAEVLTRATNEVTGVMSLVANCDLTKKITNDYKDSLNDLMKSVNISVEMLSKTMIETNKTSCSVFNAS